MSKKKPSTKSAPRPTENIDPEALSTSESLHVGTVALPGHPKRSRSQCLGDITIAVGTLDCMRSLVQFAGMMDVVDGFVSGAVSDGHTLLGRSAQYDFEVPSRFNREAAIAFIAAVLSCLTDGELFRFDEFFRFIYREIPSERPSKSAAAKAASSALKRIGVGENN